MFTGIIERVGMLVESREVSAGKRLRVDAGSMADTCMLGASISVSGVCLTVAHIDHSVLSFDVISETLQRSSLGMKHRGDFVNLERSLRVGDRLDGHFVQGHIDGTGTVVRIDDSPRDWRIQIRPESPLLPFIIPKGSIAIDGVSLTIAEIDIDTFCVALIPTTLDRTTLSKLQRGDMVNLESDIIARTVVHRLASTKPSSGLSKDQLHKAGFA